MTLMNGARGPMNTNPRQLLAVLGVLLVGVVIYLGLTQNNSSSEQYTRIEEQTRSDVKPPSESSSIPAYASYQIEGRAWKVECYSVGPVYVELDSIQKFRGANGKFLTHKEFCDLYI